MNRRLPLVSMLSSLFFIPCSHAFAEVQSKINNERRESTKYDPVERYNFWIDQSKRAGDASEEALKRIPVFGKVYKAASDASQVILDQSKDNVGQDDASGRSSDSQ